MIEFQINDPHKLEVEQKRLPLTFHLSTPETFNKETIPVVVLHGYGEYSNSPYMESLHKSMTQKYNLAIISVNYVGTFTKKKFITLESKPYDFLNESIQLQPGNKDLLLDILVNLNNNNQEFIQLLQRRGMTRRNSFLEFERTIGLLIHKISNNLCDGLYIIERLYEMGFDHGLVSFNSDTKGDHNDFGLIQAIDVLTAISHIRSQEEYSDLDWSKLSIAGTSHGGYLASMCDKLAPNTFNKIIDNSGWLYPPDNEIISNNIKNRFIKMNFVSNENNYWSKDPLSKNYFSPHHEEIRSLNNELHINEQKKQTIEYDHKKYYFSHTAEDDLIPIVQKDQYVNKLDELYDLEYIRLDDQNKLDGKTFKTLEHGAKASLKGLIIDFIINREFKGAREKNDFDNKSIIEYRCSDGTYIVDFTKKYPLIQFTSNNSK